MNEKMRCGGCYHDHSFHDAVTPFGYLAVIGINHGDGWRYCGCVHYWPMRVVNA